MLLCLFDDRIEETFSVQIEHRKRTVRSVLLRRLNFQVCQLLKVGEKLENLQLR